MRVYTVSFMMVDILGKHCTLIMMNGYPPNGGWSLLGFEGSMEWLRGCLGLESPIVEGVEY